MPAVNLAPNTIFTIGDFAVKNSMLASIFISIVLIILALLIRRGAGVIPTRTQTAFEMVFDFMFEKMEMIFGSRKVAIKFIPLIITIFLFLLVANQFSFIPLVESIVINGNDILRTPTSDYSLPIALAVIVLFIAHALALSKSPIRHIGNFIKIAPFFKIKSIRELPMVLMDFAMGLLDIVGEFAKFASISTRLFGNVFAGGVVVLVISSLTVFTRYFVPMPFIILGILSGLVQAFVFAMLATIFISSSLKGVETSET